MREQTWRTAWLENLDLETCLEHLRAGVVGRVGVVVDGVPIVLPVNYRLVETLGLTWVALRTRPGNVIDQASNQGRVRDRRRRPERTTGLVGARARHAPPHRPGRGELPRTLRLGALADAPSETPGW